MADSTPAHLPISRWSDPTSLVVGARVVIRRRLTDASPHGDHFTDVTHDSGYTYWDYTAGRFGRKQGMRIDMQWASPALAEHAGEVNVDKDERAAKGSSDHAPLIVDYDGI